MCEEVIGDERVDRGHWPTILRESRPNHRTGGQIGVQELAGLWEDQVSLEHLAAGGFVRSRQVIVVLVRGIIEIREVQLSYRIEQRGYWLADCVAHFVMP